MSENDFTPEDAAQAAGNPPRRDIFNQGVYEMEMDVRPPYKLPWQRGRLHLSHDIYYPPKPLQPEDLHHLPLWYLFPENQVEIPAVRRAFDHLVGFGESTTGFHKARGRKLNVLGSGVIVREDGTVATAAHVLRALLTEGQIEPGRVMRLGDEEISLEDGRVIYLPKGPLDADFGLVRIPALAGREPITLPPTAVSTRGFTSGTPVFAVGYPQRHHGTPSASAGRVTDWNLQRASVTVGHLLTLPGMSGGPIVNYQGELVGLVSRRTDVEPTNLGNKSKVYGYGENHAVATTPFQRIFTSSRG
jgi:S1-C subfamily serine protease